VSVSSRSSRMTMRMDVATGGVRVSVPRQSSASGVMAFVRSHEGWIRAHAARMPERVRLLPGTAIPVLGVERRIRQDMCTRSAARLHDGADGPEIVVGRTEFPENRVVDLLKEEARRHLAALTRQKAAAIGRQAAGVTVKDTTSRWGICAPDGSIAYSWRIVLAPLDVTDYLVAHEVAHLEQMNHGPRFWRVCRSLSAMSPERADAWLSFHGKRLLRHGPP